MNKTLSTRDISFALGALAELLRVDDYNYAVVKAQEAIGFIENYIAINNPSLKILLRKEAEFAKTLHTYMRKCGDDPTSNVLYTLIDNHRGLDVWYGFIRGCVKVIFPSNATISICDLKSSTIYLGGMDNINTQMTPDNILMYNALKMWGDDFIRFVWDNIKQDYL